MWCEKQIWFIQIWNIFQFLFSNCLHSPRYYINNSLEIMSIYWCSFERSYEKHWCQGKREMKTFYFSRCYKNTQNERSTSEKHFLIRLIMLDLVQQRYTTWKVSAFGSFLVHIQFECEKIRARKTPNTDTFHAVILIRIREK